MTVPIAIIGTGIAGLSAAQALTAAGIRCTFSTRAAAAAVGCPASAATQVRWTWVRSISPLVTDASPLRSSSGKPRGTLPSGHPCFTTSTLAGSARRRMNRCAGSASPA
ncbi:hypothetical protein E0H95_17235 [Pseudomonas syringae pv. tomato]|nr:hypothetical protein [Pseudomonas syringae pv. tomato]